MKKTAWGQDLRLAARFLPGPARRRCEAAGLLSEPKLDAIIISSLTNVRYLTGFTGSNAALLLHKDGQAKLFTDPRYTIQASQQADCPVKVASGPLAKSVLAEIRRKGSKRIGFEADKLTVAQLEALRKDLPIRAELVPTAGLVESLRMVKDESEIALIRESVTLNSNALAAALKRLKPGMSESALAAEIDYQSRKLGADGPSFDTIVAAGSRSALPHAHPGEAKIEAGIVLIDMGAFLHGYASDMTRMVHLGKASPKYKRAYKAVLEAQLAAIEAVKPGAKTSAVDKAAREVLKAHGLDREFVHSTGHGLGLEIHEPPRIGRKDKSRLRTGMAITIEPGVYIEGWGGIRIEDTVLVTQSGCEILTPTARELLEL
ncbi:MAG: aminopeptidase P family protein [Acidobacteriota bacterium]|nr:aminopeptidase P family protein [Acidobacteriota bacterium]